MQINLTSSMGDDVSLRIDEIESLQAIKDSTSVSTVVITSDAEEFHVIETLLEIAEKIVSSTERSDLDRFVL